MQALNISEIQQVAGGNNPFPVCRNPVYDRVSQAIQTQRDRGEPVTQLQLDFLKALPKPSCNSLLTRLTGLDSYTQFV